MKILILGLGAVGTAYGFTFKKAGHEVYHFIRENKRDSVQKRLDISFLDGRYREKGENKKDFYEVALAEDTSYDFIFISVSPDMVEDAVKTIRDNNIKGTLVLFNALWYTRKELEQITSGYEYIFAYPLTAGKINEKTFDFVLFKSIMLERKEKSNIKNYDDIVKLFNDCDIEIESPYDMLQWIWVYMGVSAGFITTAGRYFDLRDTKNAFFSVVNSSGAISNSFASIRQICSIIRSRGVDLRYYKDILSNYNTPPMIAGMVIRNSLKNNEFMRRILSLDIDIKDLFYVCRVVYECGKENDVDCPVFYENYEEMMKKYS